MYCTYVMMSRGVTACSVNTCKSIQTHREYLSVSCTRKVKCTHDRGVEFAKFEVGYPTFMFELTAILVRSILRYFCEKIKRELFAVSKKKNTVDVISLCFGLGWQVWRENVGRNRMHLLVILSIL